MNGNANTTTTRPGGWAAMAAAALVAVTGCVTRESINRDVAAARQAAAREVRAEPEITVHGMITLEDAWKLALGYNKDLAIALKGKDYARGQILESYAKALPILSGNAGYDRLDEASSLRVGDQNIPLGFEDNYSAGLTVKQPLYRGGAIAAALRAAQLHAALNDEAVRSAIEGVVYQTAREYHDAILARNLIAVETQAVTAAEAHLDDVRRRRRSGVASDYDVLRSEVEVSNLQAELIRQRNAFHLGMTRLLKTMGVSQTALVEPAGDLVYRPLSVDVEEALRLARLNRPDVYQAELAVRLQREALRVARSAYWPQVDAFLAQRWSNPDPHSPTRDDWGDAWTAGATLSVPIFDGFEHRGRVLQEKVRLEQAELRQRDTEEAVALEVRQASLSLKDAQELVESQKMNLQRAGEALRLVQTGYREGVNTEVEIADAITALTRTRALYYQATHAHIVARLNLQRAMGMLGPRAGDIAVRPADLRPAILSDAPADTRPAAAPAGTQNSDQGAIP